MVAGADLVLDRMQDLPAAVATMLPPPCARPASG
jgi:hypothetical protein